jgi:hypothetical protein
MSRVNLSLKQDNQEDDIFASILNLKQDDDDELYPSGRDFMENLPSFSCIEAYNGHRFESVGLLESNMAEFEKLGTGKSLEHSQLWQYYQDVNIEDLHKEEDGVSTLWNNSKISPAPQGTHSK